MNTQSVLSSWLLCIPCVFPPEELDEYLHIFLWFFIDYLPILLVLSNNHIKPEEYEAGIRPIPPVEIRKEYTTTTRTAPTAYSLRLTCPAELRQYAKGLISVKMSYFGAKYSVGEAGGNQSIPGQNMWPVPLCVQLKL